jgi:ABC-type transport system involved in cytochrome c biogenesis permease subunit
MASYCVVILSLIFYSLRVILDVTYLNIPYFKLVIEMSHVVVMFISFAFFSLYLNE